MPVYFLVCVCLRACTCTPVRALPSSGTGPGAAVGPPCHQPFHIEQDVQAPLQRSAWGSCPLFDVTSVLLWSSSTKPHSCTVIHSSWDNGGTLWWKNIWSLQEQRSQTTCWIKAHLCCLCCSTWRIRLVLFYLFNYHQQFSLQYPNQQWMNQIHRQSTG